MNTIQIYKKEVSDFIIFDLEGVLIDNGERYNKALKAANPNAKNDSELKPYEKRRFWRYFFDPNLALKLDKVNLKALELFDSYVKQGKKVIILSGTRKEIVKTLLDKIKEVARKKGYRFEPYIVIWRTKGDYRKAPEFKLNKIRELEKLLGEPVEIVYDDKEEVIKKMTREGINAVLWRNHKNKKLG